jgi:hypothetical protein
VLIIVRLISLAPRVGLFQAEPLLTGLGVLRSPGRWKWFHASRAPREFNLLPAYDLREVLTNTALTVCSTFSLLHFGHCFVALSCSLMLSTRVNS